MNDSYIESVGVTSRNLVPINEQSHSRVKRSTAHITNNEYTIEVLVAVDKKMQEYHGETLKSYVLTLMSIVSIPT